MTTPQTPNKFDNLADDSALDNLPEFDSESPPPTTGATRAKLNFDSKRYNEEHKQMVNPTGDWLRDDRWEFDPERHIVTRHDDCMPGDLNPEGRTTFLFSGKPAERVVNGMSYQPHLFCRISPDNRYKEDEPDKFDLPRRLFDMARETYLAIHGEEMTGEDQLIHLMTEDTIILNTMNGDDGPVVLRIKPPQQRRRSGRR